MAEMIFVISEEKLRDLFSYLLIDKCEIVRQTLDKNPDKSVKDISVIWNDIESRMCQFFFKNSSFADDEFKISIIKNIHMGLVNSVEQMLGNGHITNYHISRSRGQPVRI